jgi:hypothetical protein
MKRSKGERDRVVAEQLLLPALQLARFLPDATVAGMIPALAATPAAAAAAAGEGVVASVSQQQGRLRLTSFTSNLRAAGILGVLPAHSLTALHLSPIDSLGADGRQLSALIARLSSLKQLRLAGRGPRSMPGSCFAGIAQLTDLTALELSWYGYRADEPLQHLLSQSLPLRRLCFRMNLPVLDMTALTTLKELTCREDTALKPGSKLPAQLQQFCSEYCEDTGPLVGLQQLQHLSLGVVLEDPEQLRCLAQLPALSHVSLQYWDASCAAPTAPAWQQLSQLSELSVEFINDNPSAQDMAAILAGVAAATSLTKLNLEARAWVGTQDAADEDAESTEVAACASLAALTCLRDLTISADSRLLLGDALALTALTSLTRLKLAFIGSAVDEVAACALACSLTQLRSLDLRGSPLGGVGCLAPIAQLSQLTELLLDHVDGMTRRGVMLLTKLTQLQQLSLKFNDEVTQAWLGQHFGTALQQR